MGGGRQSRPCPYPPETPPSVVQSGDSIHVKPTFLEPTGQQDHLTQADRCLA